MIHHLIYCNLPMFFCMDPNCGGVLPYPIHVHVKVSRTSWSHHEFIMYTWQSDFLMPVLQQVHDHWPTSSHMKPELFQATGREPQVLQVSSVLENGLVPTSWAGQVSYRKLALSERHRRVCKSATRSTGRSTSATSPHEIIRELKNCHSFCDVVITLPVSSVLNASFGQWGSQRYTIEAPIKEPGRLPRVSWSGRDKQKAGESSCYLFDDHRNLEGELSSSLKPSASAFPVETWWHSF